MVCDIRAIVTSPSPQIVQAQLYTQPHWHWKLLRTNHMLSVWEPSFVRLSHPRDWECCSKNWSCRIDTMGPEREFSYLLFDTESSVGRGNTVHTNCGSVGPHRMSLHTSQMAVCLAHLDLLRSITAGLAYLPSRYNCYLMLFRQTKLHAWKFVRIAVL